MTNGAAYEIDESDRLPPLSEFLAELVGVVNFDADSEIEEAVSISEMTIDLPFELGLLQELDAWQLDAAPPTQKFETTVMPVWHRVRLRVAVEDGERSFEPVES